MNDAVQGQAEGLYDNPYYYNNVYGHALALLSRHWPRTSEPRVHLDVGCGYGRIAEPLSAELGVTYVGVDANVGGLQSLRSRGFEAHRLWLAGEEETYLALQRVVGDRQLASISMLDTLEHLADGNAILAAIRRLAVQHAALVVISVPNVTHRDIGFRLAFGRWDYTEEGLLDHTHLRLFGPEMLQRVLQHAGLYAFDQNDIRVAESDQHFPADHPALARGTELHGYLSWLRQGAGGASDVNQFVRICAPGRPGLAAPFLRPGAELQPPFLSVVMRTQGKRPHTMEEALTGLAGQSDDDFEVIVVGHRLEFERQKRVERIIEDSPNWLRAKCRLLLVDDGNRTRPLNEGFAAARGRYIAILDDDDLPFGNWVETFRKLDGQAPGRLLRASVVRQDVTTIEVAGLPGLRAVDSPKRVYPSTFDLFDHLRTNHTPPVSVAFPRGVFHDLRFRFDETLTTTEDWDFIMRTALVAGVVCSPEITAIYRWWPKDESSRTVHSTEEWQRNHRRILEKMDEMPTVFPAGTIGRIRSLLDVCDHCHCMPEDKDAERARRIGDVTAILASTSWQITAPLRLLARALGRPAADYSRISSLGAGDLRELAQALRQSTSWRLSAPLRRLRGR